MSAELIEQIKNVAPEYAMDVAQTAAQQIPDSEFPRFRSWCYGDETKRREEVAAEEAGGVKMLQKLRESGVIEAPVYEAESVDGFTSWVSPGTDQTRMYLRGDRVKHEGAVWESLVDFNSWEPSPDAHGAWVNITSVLFPPADGQPVEYVDNQHYTAGQKVTFDGAVYECAQDHFAAAGWTPVNAHAMWQKQEG